jgi:hypothetical protein
MQEPQPCEHKDADAISDVSLDRMFWCPECLRFVRGEELPEGPLRDYWRGKKEAWGGR